mmetsp:Transcript_49343/g.88742  ORF Transcript_49343/g.88742 Transcript_49343/m.88742 type:complete len:465 (-) Transcript_49343:1063-2457(-)
MGANQTALVALCALVHVHHRHIDGDASLLVLARTARHAATRYESTYGQGVAIQAVARLLNLLGKLIRVLHFWEHAGALAVGHKLAPGTTGLTVGFQGGPSCWDLTGDDAFNGCIHTGDVHVHHLVALLAVHLLDTFLQHLHCLLVRHDQAELEEDRLHDHVDALAEASLHSNFRGIDNEELRLLLGQVPAHLGWQLRFQLAGFPGAVDDANGVGLQVARHVVLLDVAGLVDSHVICSTHVVGCMDRFGPEAQMADRHPTALLRVVLEVRLGMQLRAESDHLHRRLVGSHRAVTAQAVEHALRCSFRQDIEPRAHGQGEVRDVIIDAHGEAWFRSLLCKVLEDRQHHVGCELFGPQSIAATNNHDLRVSAGLERGSYLQQQWLSLGALLLGAVQDADSLGHLRQGGEESGAVPRPEEPDLQHANTLALGLGQVCRCLTAGDSSTAHHDDDVLGLWVSLVAIEREM